MNLFHKLYVKTSLVLDAYMCKLLHLKHFLTGEYGGYQQVLFRKITVTELILQ